MSKYVRNFESFRQHKNSEQVNEEFLGNLLAAAKGAFKNFLTGITAPFKTIKDDFKKGLKKDELKKKVTTMLDTLLKTTSDSINKAEDEAALNNIVDQFHKEFEEKCAEIDKEIKAVKESKLIMEASVKGSLITGRVLLGMVKQKATELKIEFDKKVAAAKDLAGKKAARIAEIKAVVDDFKKKVVDDKYIDEQTKKYKEENKIEGGDTGGGGSIILDWGDVEIELQPIKNHKNGSAYNYQVIKSNSKKLIVKEGEELVTVIEGIAKKGETVKLTKFLRAGMPGTLDDYETGKLERIVVDGKEVDNHEMGEVKAEGQEDLVKTLGELKTKNADAIKKLGDIAKIYEDPAANKDKIAEIEKVIGAGGGE
jgi:hypothetical protein